MSPFPPPADNIGELEGYHSPQVPVEVRLNTNESPYPAPRAWLEAVLDALGDVPFNRYPDRSAGALRAALADLHDVRPTQVFVANGSNEVIQTLLLTYGGPGRAAAVFEPTYAMHGQISRVTSTAVAIGERHPDFTLDLTEVKRVLHEAEPSITFLCSPNNPTGLSEPSEVVDQVRELAPGLVVVDEAYGQFSAWTALDMVDDEHPLAVCRTFSKTWSMAASRLGYLVGPTSVVSEMEKRVLPYHLDAVKQVAGRLAIGFRAEMDERVRLLVAERSRVQSRLREMPVHVWPSDANFILFRPRSRTGDEVWHALLDHSVLVRNCSTWPRLENCLRVTIGTPYEDDRFLSALEAVL